jgi:hypothetical protein
MTTGTDGRNRYRACLEAGIRPQFEEYEGPPEKLAAHIRSRNEHRRHLSEEYQEEQRRERIALAHEMRELDMSLRTIADKLGVSHMQVKRYLESDHPGVTHVTPESQPPDDSVNAPDDATATSDSDQSSARPEESKTVPQAKPRKRTSGKVKGKDGKLYPARKRSPQLLAGIDQASGGGCRDPRLGPAAGTSTRWTSRPWPRVCRDPPLGPQQPAPAPSRAKSDPMSYLPP